MQKYCKTFFGGGSCEEVLIFKDIYHFDIGNLDSYVPHTYVHPDSRSLHPLKIY